MPVPYRRADRVADAIHRELSRLLLREAKDPRLAGVTISAVEVSADLRHAQVLFTSTGGAGTPAELEGLRSAAGFLRGQLGKVLRLRYVPELAFEADRSLEQGLHIASLLKQIAGEKTDA